MVVSKDISVMLSGDSFVLVVGFLLVMVVVSEDISVMLSDNSFILVVGSLIVIVVVIVLVFGVVRVLGVVVIVISGAAGMVVLGIDEVVEVVSAAPPTWVIVQSTSLG